MLCWIHWTDIAGVLLLGRPQTSCWDECPLKKEQRITDVVGVSECWRFYAVPTTMVIFTVKTSFDIFSLSQQQVWTFSVLGDQIYEMRCLFVAVGLNARFIVLPH